MSIRKHVKAVDKLGKIYGSYRYSDAPHLKYRNVHTKLVTVVAKTPSGKRVYKNATRDFKKAAA